MPRSYTLILSLASRSSNTIIRRLPPSSVRRILTGASQFACTCPISRLSKNIVMYAMFSGSPGTCAIPVADTATGCCPSTSSMMERS